MHIPVVRGEGTCKPHEFARKDGGTSDQDPDSDCDDVCHCEDQTPSPLPLGFFTSHWLFFQAFLKATFSHKNLPGLLGIYQYIVCVVKV